MPVSIQRRQQAAERVAEEVDRLVRHESCYGETDGVGFDETMAYSAVAHTLATWWSTMTEEQMVERLKAVVASTRAAWHNMQAGG